MILPPPDSLERLTHADLIGVVRDLIGEVTRMQAETEKLGGALAKLRVEHQAVKDELARLKHLPRLCRKLFLAVDWDMIAGNDSSGTAR